MHNHNAEGKLREVMFVFKSAVDRYQNVAAALRANDESGVGQGSPIDVGDGLHLMPDERLAQTRIHAFIYEDTHSMSWVLPSSSS